MTVKIIEAPTYDDHLKLERCPHCRVQDPNLTLEWERITWTEINSHGRAWATFICRTCGGALLAQTQIAFTGHRWDILHPIQQTIYPQVASVSEDIPDRARRYLAQALNSLSQPDAAVMVAASAVDAMLKAKSLTKGSVKARIEQAVEQNMITRGMADWADEVRIAANEQRHADGEYEHSTTDEADRLIKFTLALGEFLFVLPARIARERAKEEPSSP